MKLIFTFLITVLSVNLYGQIPTTGLTGCYWFSGNTADSSGNANHGTNNGAVLTNDRFGNPNSAYLFDGVSANITVPNIAAAGNAARSICAWIRFSGTNWHGIVATGTPNNSETFNLVVNYYNPTVGVMGFSNDFYPTSGAAVNDSVWHLLIATYDGAGTVKTYVDGILDNSGSYSYNTSGQNNYIGCSNHFPSNVYYFNGAIDDVLFYDHALSSTEIDSVYYNHLMGIGENNFAGSALSVFPNPVSTTATVCFSRSKNISVQLCNAFGQLMEYLKPQDSSVELDMTSRPAGVYYVTITDEFNNRTMRKVVKM